MRKIQLFGFLIIVTLACRFVAFAGAEDGGLAKGHSESLIEFSTSEFTQPYLDVSADGKTIYFDLLGEIYFVSILGGKAEKLGLGPGWKERPILSPDGTQLAFLSDRAGTYSVWVKRIGQESEPIIYEDRPQADVVSAVWVSKSSILTSARSVGHPISHNLAVATEDILQGMDSTQLPVRHAASMTADKQGRFVYFVRGTDFKRLDRHTGIEKSQQGLPPYASQLRLSPNGLQMGFVRQTERMSIATSPFLSLLDLGNGKITETNCTIEIDHGTDGDGAKSAAYAFMPDGQSVVLAQGGAIRLCRIGGSTSAVPITASVSVTTAPRAVPLLRKVGPQLRFLTIAPQGEQIAFTSGDKIWIRSRKNGLVARLSRGDSSEFMPSYSPDGREIAYITLDEWGAGRLIVQKLSSGKTRDVVRSTKVLANPTWSPDGSRISYVEAEPNIPASAPAGSVSLKWIDLNKNQSGIFVSGLFGFLNTHRYYPTMTWDQLGEGIFYSQYQVEPSNRKMMYVARSGTPEAIYNLEWSIWEALVSPSGRYIAFMDERGISVAPFQGSSAENISIDGQLLAGLKRVSDSRADYMAWTRDDRLAWSVQDQVRITDEELNEEVSTKVVIPPLHRPSQQSRVAYVGSRIITMENDKVIENGAVVTSGSAIEYVGPLSEAPLNGASVVELSGMTIIPGLIDVHQHDNWSNLDVTPQLSQRLFTSAAYGVTTVFDPSYTDTDGGALREASSEDTFIGSTMYTSGLATLGVDRNPSFTRIKSYEDAVVAVRRKAVAGSILVKDYLQGGRDQRRWLAQAARSEGVGIVGHERNDTRTYMTMIVDGFTGAEHTIFVGGGQIYGDIKNMFVKSGIYMTPTLADAYGLFAGTYFYAKNPLGSNYAKCLMSKEDAIGLTREKEWTGSGPLQESSIFDMAKQYAHMLNSGAKVTIGGHTSPAGIGTHWEMWFLEMAGASRLEVLRAATINGAEKLGLASSVGSISVGKTADFIVLNGNPLDDIKHTADIVRVIRRGRTLSWPAERFQPITWSMQGSWNGCRKWNLGLGAAKDPANNNAGKH